MTKFYHKYKKALEKHGYTVDEHGFVFDKEKNQCASEDRFGNVYTNDVNVTAICIEAEEKKTLAKLAKTRKTANEYSESGETIKA